MGLVKIFNREGAKNAKERISQSGVNRFDWVRFIAITRQ
jgi:hypothetical protein